MMSKRRGRLVGMERNGKLPHPRCLPRPRQPQFSIPPKHSAASTVRVKMASFAPDVDGVVSPVPGQPSCLDVRMLTSPWRWGPVIDGDDVFDLEPSEQRLHPFPTRPVPEPSGALFNQRKPSEEQEQISWPHAVP